MAVAGVPRVVAVGDLHGDLDNALATLQLAGVIDAQGHWVAQDTILVQTGDTTDRGPDSRAILDLFQRLEKEATAAGGNVIALLGNHEVMNLLGDLRYVHAGDVESFGGAEAREQAFAPSGAYGAWLRQKDVATQVGKTVFVHGGIHPEFAKLGISAINDAARDAIAQGTGAVLGSDGPLWFRDFVTLEEERACALLSQSLDALGASRMVVGHTTQRSGRIQTRCEGQLHIIDIGISDAYGGHLGAWECNVEDARALYPEGPMDLEDPS